MVHDFLPDKLCSKGHPTVKRYANGQVQCLTCQNAWRKAREKGLRDGTWAPRKQRSKTEMLPVRMQIAALAGSGIAPARIAEEVHRSRDYVEQVIRKDVKTDEQLRALYLEAERKLAPRAFAVAEKLIAHIENTAEGYETVVGVNKKTGETITGHVTTQPHHAAAALREMRPFIGMGDRPQMQEQGGSAQEALAAAMVKNPEVARSVVEAVMAARARQLRSGE